MAEVTPRPTTTANNRRVTIIKATTADLKHQTRIGRQMEAITVPQLRLRARNRKHGGSLPMGHQASRQPPVSIGPQQEIWAGIVMYNPAIAAKGEDRGAIGVEDTEAEVSVEETTSSRTKRNYDVCLSRHVHNVHWAPIYVDNKSNTYKCHCQNCQYIILASIGGSVVIICSMNHYVQFSGQ